MSSHHSICEVGKFSYSFQWFVICSTVLNLQYQIKSNDIHSIPRETDAGKSTNWASWKGTRLNQPFNKKINQFPNWQSYKIRLHFIVCKNRHTCTLQMFMWLVGNRLHRTIAYDMWHRTVRGTTIAYSCFAPKYADQIKSALIKCEWQTRLIHLSLTMGNIGFVVFFIPVLMCSWWWYNESSILAMQCK